MDDEEERSVGRGRVSNSLSLSLRCSSISQYQTRSTEFEKSLRTVVLFLLDPRIERSWKNQSSNLVPKDQSCRAERLLFTTTGFWSDPPSHKRICLCWGLSGKIAGNRTLAGYPKFTTGFLWLLFVWCDTAVWVTSGICMHERIVMRMTWPWTTGSRICWSTNLSYPHLNLY